MSIGAISTATSSGIFANTTTVVTMSGWALAAIIATACVLIFLMSLAAIILVTHRKENQDRAFDRLPVRRRTLKSCRPKLDKDHFLKSSVGVSDALKEALRWTEFLLIDQNHDDLFWLAARIQYFVDYYKDNPSGLLLREKQQVKEQKNDPQLVVSQRDRQLYVERFFSKLPVHLKTGVKAEENKQRIADYIDRVIPHCPSGTGVVFPNIYPLDTQNNFIERLEKKSNNYSYNKRLRDYQNMELRAHAQQNQKMQEDSEQEGDEELFLNFFNSYYYQVPHHLKTREGVDIIFSNIPVIIRDHMVNGNFPFRRIQGIDSKEEFTLSHWRVLFTQLSFLRNQFNTGVKVRINADLDGVTPPEDRRQKVHVFGSFHENKELYKQLQSLAQTDDRAHFLWYYALAIEVHQSERLDLQYFADESKQTLSELKSVLTAFITEHRESKNKLRPGVEARSSNVQGEQTKGALFAWGGVDTDQEVVPNQNSAKAFELLSAKRARSFREPFPELGADKTNVEEVSSGDETVEWSAELGMPLLAQKVESCDNIDDGFFMEWEQSRRHSNPF